MELRADPKGAARATVIEASVKPGKGATASVIIQTGTLKVGDAFICGPYSGKVKLMLDDGGNQLKEAGPSTPVEVLGFSGVPKVGDELVVMDNERGAKKLSEARLETIRQYLDEFLLVVHEEDRALTHPTPLLPSAHSPRAES